jgi:hypothetical protein
LDLAAELDFEPYLAIVVAQSGINIPVEQADSYINDQRPDFVAVAQSVLKGFSNELDAFVRLAAAGPGISDKVDIGDDSIDQTAVTDADLLSLTQASWQVVAGLYFNTDGTPKP